MCSGELANPCSATAPATIRFMYAKVNEPSIAFITGWITLI
jgi:hypothetical protein